MVHLLDPPIKVTLLPTGGCFINSLLYLADDPISILVRSVFYPIVVEASREKGKDLPDAPVHGWKISSIDTSSMVVTFESVAPGDIPSLEALQDREAARDLFNGEKGNGRSIPDGVAQDDPE